MLVAVKVFGFDLRLQNYALNFSFGEPPKPTQIGWVNHRQVIERKIPFGYQATCQDAVNPIEFRKFPATPVCTVLEFLTRHYIHIPTRAPTGCAEILKPNGEFDRVSGDDDDAAKQRKEVKTNVVCVWKLQMLSDCGGIRIGELAFPTVHVPSRSTA
jgi:hypothetical protein